MKKYLSTFIVFLLSFSVYAQIDTSGIRVDSSQLNSVKIISESLQINTDSINILQKNVDSIRIEKQSLDKEKQRLIKEGKSILASNEKLNKNNIALSDAISLLSEKKQLLTQQIAVLNTQMNSLNDSLAEKAKKIAFNDSTNKAADSIIKNKTVKNDSIQKEIKTSDSTLKERQAAVSKQLDSLETIAKFELDTSNSAKVYYWIKESDKSKLKDYEKHYKRNVLYSPNPPCIKVKQVNITVKEGIILEVIVQTDSGIYRNSRSVVDLLHLGNSKKVLILFHEHQSYNPKLDNSCIFFDDIVKYTPIRSYYDVAYGDFDITLMPTSSGRYYLLRESTSINTYFNIAAFTDIKGISGEPNGLAQFTADAKFITNTRNIRNSAIAPFNYISFRGGLSKFDNDFKGTELKNNDSVSRKDLLQRSNYSLGVKANLFKWFLSPKPAFLYDKFELNIGYNFLGTKVFDTLFKDAARTVTDTITKNVTQNQLYIEPVITFSRHRNFSMNLTLPVYFNNVKHNATTDLGIKNISTEIWAAPGISLMYFGKRDAGSKLFFRYNNYINLKNKTQSFTQMQLGYSINLTEVWGGSEKK